MQVHTDIEHLPSFTSAVITIGTFDGVHRGHQQIIAQMQEEARRAGGETVIVTFHPHPRKVVHHGAQDLKLLTTIEERIELLRAYGIDHLVIVPFTEAFSSLQPQDYVEHFLVARFRPHCVIIGYDHHFGKDRGGNYRLLEAYAARGLFQLREIPQQVLNDSLVSSTLIRQALNEGQADRANSLLGYPFFFSGTVAGGARRGRTIGFPTANIEVPNPEKIIPGNGVYVVEVQIGSGRAVSRFQGMMNIGVRPTVNGTTRTIEVHLFDFNEDIYGSTVRVSVMHFLREEQKFDGIDALKQQLEKDRQDSIHYFNHQFLQ